MRVVGAVMISYTIPAIPTRYRGRLYRSRLEARWAAFFDLLGWEHEYEPFELNGWIPDFLLRGTWASGYRAGVLVEIKPVSTYDRDVGQKVIDACADTEWEGGTDRLLFGVAPWRAERRWLNIGWGILEGQHADGDTVAPRRCSINDYDVPIICFADSKGVTFDLGQPGRPIGGMLTGYDSYFDIHYPQHFKADLLHDLIAQDEWIGNIEKLWAEATNRVQWRGRETQS
jgi:hypothetical protein